MRFSGRQKKPKKGESGADGLLEIIFDGVFEAAGSKRVPLPVRIFLTGILALFYLGLIGFIVWVGIYSKSKILMAVSAVVVIGSAVLVWCLVRRRKQRK